MNEEHTGASTYRNGAAEDDRIHSSASVEQATACGEVRQAVDTVVDVAGHCELAKCDRPVGQCLTKDHAVSGNAGP